MAVRAVTPRRARAVCVALAGAVWATQAAASSMRCAGGVVGVGDAPGTVLARCGEPDTGPSASVGCARTTATAYT